jgi:tRNA(adenine34) deaminase
MSDDRARHERHMRRCIDLARRAHATGDTPVGSLVARGDDVIGEGVEAVRARDDVTAHAEIEALRRACTGLGSRDLSGCTIYTSVEPCPMCAYAIRLARISAVVSGARPSGADYAISGYSVLTDASLLPNHPPPVVIRDVLADACRARLDERKAGGTAPAS